jgi:3-oxoadipate enol-lactonase
VPFVTATGLKIHYTLNAAARPSGAPVILLHGLGSSGEDWILQIEALAGQRPVATIDLPGHGESQGYSGLPSLNDFADTVDAAIDGLTADRVHVIGLSLGGAVGLAMAIGHGARLASLVAVGAPSRRRLTGSGTILGLIRLGAVLLGRMDWTASLTAWDLFPRQDQQGLREVAAERLARNRRGDFLRAVIALGRMRLWNRLDDIGCPVLVVAGAGDRTVPFSLQRRTAGRIPGARFVALADAGHACPVDSPERFNRIVGTFLAEAESTDGRPGQGLSGGKQPAGNAERAVTGGV